jgi:hypothetical protein
MTACLLTSFGFLALASAPVAAQPPAPPVVRIVRVAPERAAWFERFEDSRRGPETVETISKTFKVGTGASLDVSNLSGDVIVIGVSGDQIAVVATKRARGSAGAFFNRSVIGAITMSGWPVRRLSWAKSRMASA